MHVLQREAKATKLGKIAVPADAEYDFAAGVWRNNEGLIAYDTRCDIQTKKNDLETGEDQKGQ
ncbi:hypothetical protein [Labrenzia sp. CP4]|jgi:hypothetical protein|uniref:hypothetical protein n=1 Tax=Labrenzia sp. CP4 TaxID=1674922 RepID=UPI000782C906|nr:hypothetical protein [Labrenzia sp. CP4]